MTLIRTAALILAILHVVGPSLVVSGQEAPAAVRMVADEGEGAKYWPR
jgi:hypothetical protein